MGMEPVNLFLEASKRCRTESWLISGGMVPDNLFPEMSKLKFEACNYGRILCEME